ncbi:Protein of unknown function [Gryllus bimaculatus]|nr:Protein of unknown function [Gryllus bimaculatus]
MRVLVGTPSHLDPVLPPPFPPQGVAEARSPEAPAGEAGRSAPPRPVDPEAVPEHRSGREAAARAAESKDAPDGSAINAGNANTPPSALDSPIHYLPPPAINFFARHSSLSSSFLTIPRQPPPSSSLLDLLRLLLELPGFSRPGMLNIRVFPTRNADCFCKHYVNITQTKLCVPIGNFLNDAKTIPPENKLLNTYFQWYTTKLTLIDPVGLPAIPHSFISQES